MLGDLSQMVLAQSLSHPGAQDVVRTCSLPPDDLLRRGGSISQLAHSCLSAGSLSFSPHGPLHKFLKCLHGMTANFFQSEWSRRKQGGSYSALLTFVTRSVKALTFHLFASYQWACRSCTGPGIRHKTCRLETGFWSPVAQQAAGLSADLHLFLLLPSPTPLTLTDTCTWSEFHYRRGILELRIPRSFLMDYQHACPFAVQVERRLHLVRL